MSTSSCVSCIARMDYAETSDRQILYAMGVRHKLAHLKLYNEHTLVCMYEETISSE